MCRLANGVLLLAVNTTVFIAKALFNDNLKDGPSNTAPDVTNLRHIHILKD